MLQLKPMRSLHAEVVFTALNKSRCVLISSPSALLSIVAGPRQSGAVCSDGKALMWGAAHFVRLPTLTPDSHSYTPREVPIDSAQEALQVFDSTLSTCLQNWTLFCVLTTKILLVGGFACCFADMLLFRIQRATDSWSRRCVCMGFQR